MKVLIIGASGLIGSNIFNQLSKIQNWLVVGTYNTFKLDQFIYFNASDISTWSTEIAKTNWDVIIHTGALTNVDECERNPELSEYLTIQSAINLSDFASMQGAQLVYISTDYVFDGENGPYNENDFPNPLNVYGKHKLIAESQIIGSIKRHLIIRVTNVYGNEFQNKNFVSRMIIKAKKNDFSEISVPYDQFATPINANDIARAIYLLLKDNKVGLYHLSSTDYMSRYNLLYKINSYYGNRLKIKPVNTKIINQHAQRPLVGGLINVKFLSEYPDFIFSNIDEYLNQMLST